MAKDQFNCNNCSNGKCSEHSKYDAKGALVFRKNPKITKCEGFREYRPMSAEREFRAARGLARI